MKWRPLISSLALVLTGLFAVTSGSVRVQDKDAVTPPELRFGWAGNDVQPEPVAGELNIVGAASSEGAVVKLWDYAKKINGGQHLPTWRQETGDCVSFGAATGCNYCQVGDIADDMENGRVPRTYRHVYPPWIYGMSRTAPDLGDGKLGRSAGSLGSWAANGMVKYGVIATDSPLAPPYSGKLADTWGRMPGPPKEVYTEAAKVKMGAVALVTSYEAARDAIANKYPVTVASNQGFRMKSELIDGHLWGVPQGSWAHQMCLIGVDDTMPAPPWSRSKKPGAIFCQNSWGPKAHYPTDAPDGAPPGGFWIDRDTIDKMLRGRDSYALSLFDGFKPRGIDWSVFSEAVASEAPPEQPESIKVVTAPEQPPAMVPVSATVGVPPVAAKSGGLATMIGGLIVTAVMAKRQARRRQERGRTLSA